MTLRIVKSADPLHVEQTVTTIYSPPGLGKSTLGFTARNALLLDFDAGAYRAAHRGDSVQIKTWNDVASISREDLAGYSTLVIDTVGRALDALAADIMERDPKAGRGGALTLQGYGKLKSEFIAFLKRVRSFGLDVVLIAHSEESKSGDDMIERIDAVGGSKSEIYKVSDAMGRLAIRDGKRVLLFSPTDTAFGKNPAQLPPLDVPIITAGATFLGDVIQQTKEALNAMTAEQREVAEALAAWKERVDAATSAKKLTALVGEIEKLDPRIRDNAKRLLWSFAKDHHFTFDAKAKKFVEPKDESSDAESTETGSTEASEEQQAELEVATA